MANFTIHIESFSILAAYQPEWILALSHVFRQSKCMKSRLPEHRQGDNNGLLGDASLL